MATFDSISDAFQGCLEDFQNDVIIAAADTLSADILRRVHNDGLDSNDQPIGNYSKSWAEIRKNPSSISSRYDTYSGGRVPSGALQTSKVDLEFSSSMRKDFGRGTREGKIVLGYENEESALKVIQNERNFNKKIIEPSPKNIEVFEEILETLVDSSLRDCFKGV